MTIDSNVMTQLEEKIEEILQRVNRLRAENEELKRQLQDAQGLREQLEVAERQMHEARYEVREQLEAREKEIGELKELLAVYDAERSEVKFRVETLLAKLEMPGG